MFGGIEAGGTKFVLAVGTGPDDLHDVTSIPTEAPDTTLPRAVAYFEERDVEAVGIAAFGPVDLDRSSDTYGSITSTPKPGWRDTDVLGVVARDLDVPVGFDTDVNGAALGEQRWGAAQGLDTFVYVTVGTGVGAGGVTGGEPLHGLLHPEMGHLLVRRHPDDTFAGSCPFHGDCLEGLAAGPALQQRWGRPAAELDADLAAAVEMEAWYLAQLAVTATYVVSPQRIVWGGGVMNLAGLAERMRERTVELLAGYLEVPAITEHTDDYLVRPGLGDHAGVLGAIALAQDAVAP